MLALDVFLLGSFTNEAGAMLAPALMEESIAAASTRAADLHSVQSVLEKKLVKQRLVEIGLQDDEIAMRLNALSDGQLHELATNLDSLMVGGDTGLGLLLALVIVLVILLLIYASGYKISVTR
jgi:hypothetical protein